MMATALRVRHNRTGYRTVISNVRRDRVECLARLCISSDFPGIENRIDHRIEGDVDALVAAIGGCARVWCCGDGGGGVCVGGMGREGSGTRRRFLACLSPVMWYVTVLLYVTGWAGRRLGHTVVQSERYSMFVAGGDGLHVLNTFLFCS